MPLEPNVRARAAELGFLACGIASLEPSGQADRLDRWLAQGHAGTMRYLHRQAAKRKRPQEIVPEARVAVVVLDNYLPPESPVGVGGSPPARAAKIAKYARGRDYHRDCGERLERLAAELRQLGASVARPFVDAGPVPERELAHRAGLGWIGKNTMLIRPGVGSFFFIGSVFTDLSLEPDRPFATEHCGTCTRCLDACPTEAFVDPGLLDATRCLSYLTIEHRGEPPEALRSEYRGWAFGCDICNDVCPWNHRFAEATSNAAYHDRGVIDRTDPYFFSGMSESEFERRFADTPLERPGLEGMRRNYRHAFSSLA
jgi:epoxyqueuosine reductase